MISFDPKFDDVRKVYYSPAEVCVILGVSKQVIFGWEKSIGYPRAIRKKNNHRRYTLFDIQVLKLIQELLIDYNKNGVKKIFPQKLEELKLKLNKQQQKPLPVKQLSPVVTVA